MMITEDNCEEYFLLYADNELTTAECSAVEAFVEQHPQHAITLNAILQTKLSADINFVFNGKEVLYKNADAEIGIENCEEYFLLYTDNELSEADREDTERFVLQHPQLQNNFTLLQQTKLAAEGIPYPDKTELYRKERRIAPLYAAWLAGTAAILLVVFSFPYLMPSDNNSNQSPVARNEKNLKVKQPTIVQQAPAMSSHPPVVESAKAESKETESTPLTNTATAMVKKKLVEQKIETGITVKTQLPQTAEHISLPPVLEKLKPEGVTQTAPVVNAQVTALKPLEEVGDEGQTEAASSLSNNDNMPKPAVYKELNTDDDAHTLYVGAFQLNKAKVNGILKSASRLLGGKPKQNME